ncbi:uncharacterized protein LOC105278053 [Ooceraea biroi]|uniref:uncharacterized protein LOC105278053 n=1 Tax=Ooceraea biroi TaxID=2015173 RepID=UPI000F07990F|nr:uncharacterized protein LOC105278053 [Ooceraea biroi]
MEKPKCVCSYEYLSLHANRRSVQSRRLRSESNSSIVSTLLQPPELRTLKSLDLDGDLNYAIDSMKSKAMPSEGVPGFFDPADSSSTTPGAQCAIVMQTATSLGCARADSYWRSARLTA